jgi:hypothetical protein
MFTGTSEATYAFINASRIVRVNGVQLSEVVLLHDRIRILMIGVRTVMSSRVAGSL